MGERKAMEHVSPFTFPYGCHSGAYGAAYAIYEHEAQLLRQDEEFIGRFLRGVELLMLSWGWDLRGRFNVADPDPDQRWQDWPIRLYKCAKSLKLLGVRGGIRIRKGVCTAAYQGRPELHVWQP